MTDDEKIRELIKNRMQDVSSSGVVTSCRVWLTVRDLMNTDVATVASDQTMALAATLMADDGISSLVVVDGGEVTGIITEKDFLARVVAKGKSAMDVKVRDVMSSPVISITPDLTVLDAGKIARQRHVKRLPVIEGGKLVGIITQTDLIRVLTSYGMWRGVEEIMTKEVATVQRETSVAEAAGIMASRGISGIVIAQGKKVAGILTERDLLKRVVAAGKDPAGVTAGEIMSSPVAKVPPYYSLFSAGRFMEKQHIRRLVVEDNKWLCGVVTQTDIFRAVEDNWLKEEEKNLKTLEESDACIYTLDLQGKITYVNPAFMRLLEAADRSQLVDKPFLPDEFWFDKREKERFFREMQRDTVVVSDLTLKAASGKRLDVTVYSTPTKNIHCRVDGRQGVVNDITAKKELVTLKEAQKALAESERRYRRITEAVTDYVYTVRFNPGRPAEPVHGQACEAVTGYSPQEFQGNPTLWLDIVYPDDLELVREQVSRCICGQDFGPIEHRIVRKDGSVRWIRRTLSPNFNPQGKLLSYDGMLQDITELKIAEQAQMQMLGELEQAGEELRDLTYLVSQELKAAPAAVLRQQDAGAATDKNGRDGPGKSHIVRTLLGRVKRMQNLIDGMLYCSQGLICERATKADLNEMISQITADVAGGEDVQIAVEDRLPVVVCTAGGVRHIFQNLIANAINFLDGTNARIVISAAQEDGHWKFGVADNGPSLDAKVLGRIFRMACNIPAQEGLEIAGCAATPSGVELTIAKRLVEALGGRIWGCSKEGRGNTFYFTLPCLPAEPRFNTAQAVLAFGK